MRKMKFLSLFLAAVMLLLPVLSVAESAEEKKPFEVDVTFEINPQFLQGMIGAQDEASAKIGEAVAGLINGLKFHGLNDTNASEVEITVNDKHLANLAVINELDKGLKIHSDLFPNSVLDMQIENMPTVDTSAITDHEALVKPVIDAIDQFKGKISEPEYTAENMFNTDFTKKSHVDMTSKEILLTAMNALKDLLGNEQMQSVLDSMKKSGMEVSLDDLEDEIKELEEADEEDLPKINADIYTNDGGDNVIRITAEQDESKADLKIGTVAGADVMDCYIDETNIAMKSVDGEKTELIINTVMQGTPFVISVVADEQATPKKVDVTISVMQTPLFTVHVTTQETDGVLLKALSEKYNADEKAVYSIKDISEGNEEIMNALMNDVQNGAGSALATLLQEFPALAALFQQ